MLEQTSKAVGTEINAQSSNTREYTLKTDRLTKKAFYKNYCISSLLIIQDLIIIYKNLWSECKIVL